MGVVEVVSFTVNSVFFVADSVANRILRKEMK